MFEIPIITKENHLLLRHLLDVLKYLRALKALRRLTDYWDDLIVYLITSRLDQIELGNTVKWDEASALKQLTDFLAQHCKALEALAHNTPNGITGSNQRKDTQAKGTVANVATTDNRCAYCGKESHVIYKCTDYLQLNISDRIKEGKLCLNCLKAASHQAKQIEQDGRQNTLIPEERMCEKHFTNTYRRNEEGCFVICLSIKEEQIQKIRDSCESALR